MRRPSSAPRLVIVAVLLAMVPLAACKEEVTGTPLGTIGAPVALLFTTQPINCQIVPPGSPITVRVAIVDAGGATVPTAWGNITLALSTNPGGSTLTGGGPIATVGGVATFSIGLNNAGDGYRLTATCSGYANILSDPFNVTLNANPLNITTTSLPSGTVGVAYSQQLFATGGTPAYTWSLASGSLPTGLTLNASTGRISGTPSVVETRAFTVRVTDTVSDTDTQALSITINSSTPALNITTTSLPGGTVGTAYSATVQATGGQPAYSWSLASGSLPTGLTLNTSTGTISGTPTTAQTASFTVRVTDTLSATDTQTLSITITSSGGGGYDLTATLCGYIAVSSSTWTPSTTIETYGDTCNFYEKIGWFKIDLASVPTGFTAATADLDFYLITADTTFTFVHATHYPPTSTAEAAATATEIIPPSGSALAICGTLNYTPTGSRNTVINSTGIAAINAALAQTTPSNRWIGIGVRDVGGG